MRDGAPPPLVRAVLRRFAVDYKTFDELWGDR